MTADRGTDIAEPNDSTYAYFVALEEWGYKTNERNRCKREKSTHDNRLYWPSHPSHVHITPSLKPCHPALLVPNLSERSIAEAEMLDEPAARVVSFAFSGSALGEKVSVRSRSGRVVEGKEMVASVTSGL